MTDTVHATNAQHTAQRDAFIERMLRSTSGLFDIFTVYMGDRLGYYQALAQHGGLTSTELAETTQTYERYAREWLEQQNGCRDLGRRR